VVNKDSLNHLDVPKMAKCTPGTKHVFEFLQANPMVRIHYTPTYSSWLNQVEIWFSKIQRDVIARGIFTSTTDLSRKLIRYIRQYNKTATPFRWRYKNADLRIKPVTQRGSYSLQ
jgi:transposase